MKDLAGSLGSLMEDVTFESVRSFALSSRNAMNLGLFPLTLRYVASGLTNYKVNKTVLAI